MILDTSMATRNPQHAIRSLGTSSTEFQLYKLQVVGSCQLIDYTEHRLQKFIETVSDPHQKMTLCAILDGYKTCKVAISWRSGKPVWINVTRESQ